MRNMTRAKLTKRQMLTRINECKSMIDAIYGPHVYTKLIADLTNFPITFKQAKLIVESSIPDIDTNALLYHVCHDLPPTYSEEKRREEKRRELLEYLDEALDSEYYYYDDDMTADMYQL